MTNALRAPMTHVRTRIPAPFLLLTGMIVLQTGSALATTLFDEVSPLGVTWLRLSWVALLLLMFSARSLWPALRNATWRDLVSVVILGTVSAGMMGLYSESTARIDLGTATALEFLGPLSVAVLAMRRRVELAWIAAAVVGVALLTRPWSGEADLVGVGIGLIGALCAALYIVLTQQVGGSFGTMHGLTLSMTIAAVVTAPFGVPAVTANPSSHVALATLGIALLFPLVPFLLDMVALQRMTRTAYSTFISMEPGVSLMIGMLVIAQRPTAVDIAGMVLVVVAGIGAARGTSRSTPGEKPSEPKRASPRDVCADRTETAADTRAQTTLYQG